MNTEIIDLIDAQFIALERLLLFRDTREYTMEILGITRKIASYRMFGNCMIVLEENHGEAALLGFITLAALLQHWQKQHDNPTWFKSQIEELELVGSEKVQGYVCPFIESPEVGIPQVIGLLNKKSPIKDFIAFCDERCPKFRIGALLFIGILFFLDENKSGQRALAV